MTLPLALSVPHAGLLVPDRLAARCLLTPEQVELDGDVGAAEIYRLAHHVREFTTTVVARAVLDLNRATDDRRQDGIVKTHTCWDEPIWREPLAAEDAEWLIDEYWRPYHGCLARWRGQVKLAVDCHTMAENGPPVGPDPGQRRPLVCLGDGGGTACPRPWVDELQRCFARYFGDSEVTVNEPFAGGYITRTHGGPAQPWVQLELSRSEALMNAGEKREAVLRALTDWCRLGLPPADFGASGSDRTPPPPQQPS